MVYLKIIISVYHAEREISDDWVSQTRALAS